MYDITGSTNIPKHTFYTHTHNICFVPYIQRVVSIAGRFVSHHAIPTKWMDHVVGTSKYRVVTIELGRIGRWPWPGRFRYSRTWRRRYTMRRVVQYRWRVDNKRPMVAFDFVPIRISWSLDRVRRMGSSRRRC